MIRTTKQFRLEGISGGYLVPPPAQSCPSITVRTTCLGLAQSSYGYLQRWNFCEPFEDWLTDPRMRNVFLRNFHCRNLWPLALCCFCTSEKSLVVFCITICHCWRQQLNLRFFPPSWAHTHTHFSFSLPMSYAQAPWVGGPPLGLLQFIYVFLARWNAPEIVSDVPFRSE